jgi:hypothetical protein
MRRQLVRSAKLSLRAVSTMPDARRLATSSNGTAATAPWSIQRVGIWVRRVIPTFTPDALAR